jgi:cytochrome c oxidase cbb3-type subunit 2
MPSYAWLKDAKVDGAVIQRHMERLTMVGVPYTPEQIAGAPAAVEGKTEMDALIAHLQGLGLARKNE